MKTRMTSNGGDVEVTGTGAEASLHRWLRYAGLESR